MSDIDARLGNLYRLLVQNLPTGIVFLLDDQLRIIMVDGGDRRRLREPPGAVVGQPLIAAFPSDSPARLENRLRAALAGEPQQFEVEADGRVYQARAVPLHNPSSPDAAGMLTLNDVTEFRDGDRALRRAERAFRTISAGNRALLHAQDEQDLLNLICQVAVETGGYRMAWVGYAERDAEKTIRPVAWAGREEGYLAGAPLTWADTEAGQRPGPISIRSGEPVIVRRITADPAFNPWRADIEQLGFGAVLAAPLLDEERIAFGCLTFYSADAEAFDARESQLLVEMAGDLAYGIRALRAGQMRLRMVEALRESEERFRLLSEGAIAGVYIVQDGRYVYVNPALARLFGFTRKEMVGQMDVIERVHPDDRAEVAENIRKRVAGEADTIHYQVRGLRKDGSTVNLEALGSRVEYQGKPSIMGMLLDVTDRVRAEQAEREQRRLAETLAATAASLIHVLDTESVLRQIVNGVSRVIGFDLIVIMAGRDEVMRQMLSLEASRSQTGAEVESVTVRVGDVPMLDRMARDCETIVVPDTDADPGWVAFQYFETARSFLGAPICFEDHILGFVKVFSATPGAYDESAGRALRAFADQAATALRSVDLYRELSTYSDFLEDAIESATAEMRRAKEQTEAIVANDPNAVLVLTSDGAIRLSNPASQKLFGYGQQEMVGRPPSMLIAPRDVPAFDGALQALMAQRTTMHLEVSAMRRDGGEFESEIALAPIEDGERLIGIVCYIRDVSLFMEVDRLKDAFVSNVSHELRTHIASLRLNSALMRSNPDKQEVYLDRQARDLDRLGNLIDNLLQLSRLDQKQAAIVLMPLDLAGWAQSLLDDFRPLVVDHGLTLQFDPGRHLPPVKADSSFLGQVLVNLLTNAINYTPRGGSITVTMHARRARGKSWAGFSVRDSGPGISPEDQERLFERFFRGSVGRAASARGTGLGLSIAQEIVSLHHGEIEVESSGVAGEGTIFRVWLPARGRPARPAKRHP